MSIGKKAAIAALINLGSIAVTWAVLLAVACVSYFSFVLHTAEAGERAQVLGVLAYCVAVFLAGAIMMTIGVWLRRGELKSAETV